MILGIETSCDETAVAIVAEDGRIVSHLLYSQNHMDYGGVVPEIAARAHIEKLAPLVEQTLQKAGIAPHDLKAIAATCGPGLIGGVVVGAMYAKGLSLCLNIPFIPINHLEGHALTIRLTESLDFPYLLLLASGGHCQFIDVRSLGDYHLMGETLDDAAGEAFDKVASMLGLPYPGGPNIESLAKEGNAHAFTFPRPLHSSLANTLEKGYTLSCNFSFSGLKTAVRHEIKRQKEHYAHDSIPLHIKADIAASFQQAVIDCILNRTEHAIHMLERPYPSLVISGGVAANKAIYEALVKLAQKYNMMAYAPPLSLCTDNGAMIAWAGMERFKFDQEKMITSAYCAWSMAFEPRPRWPLMDLSPSFPVV